MDPIAEIRKLYYRATRATIERDLARAVEILKSLPTEDERERAAVYMDGLSQLRSEWRGRGAARAAGAGTPTRKPTRRRSGRR